MKSMNRGYPIPIVHLVVVLVLAGCFFLTACAAAEDSPQDPSAAGSPPFTHPAETPDLLQGILTAIHTMISGVFPGTDRNGNARTPLSGTLVANGKIVAAYLYIYPGPDDDSYPVLMSVHDRIPWKKVNRIYIGFATVHDGILTDLPAGDSAEDTARREENIRRIRNTVALCRQNNPDAEIFITSNFGREFDPEYLAAAQDPQKFADSALAYLKEYDLDGYDMDWESRNIDDYAPQLDALLSACHATFASAGMNPHGRAYKLTHTIWPGVESPETVAGIKDSVDQINIMSYGPGDTYDLASYADSYAQAGFPYGKMIGGVESESGYPESGGPDTQASVTAKCSYVKEHNLAGIFEWRMDNDMRDGDGPPTFQVTGWMSGCLAGEISFLK
jgi:predicted small secreted protein